MTALVGESPWRPSWRADPVVARLADGHYSRQKPGSPQFVPPGSCFVWVKWLDENRWGVEEVYRQPASDIDLAFHGISTPKLVRLPGTSAPRAGTETTDA